MAEGLHIDSDWKKQAQEEKRKLAEEQQKKAAAQAASAAALPAGPSGAATPEGRIGPSRGAAGGVRGRREMPEASFATLVQSLWTQALYYLGDVGLGSGEGGVNLDMAKHQVDTLNVIETKTANNLDADEQRLLDAALYETRTRFINIASQYI